MGEVGGESIDDKGESPSEQLPVLPVRSAPSKAALVEQVAFEPLKYALSMHVGRSIGLVSVCGWRGRWVVASASRSAHRIVGQPVGRLVGGTPRVSIGRGPHAGCLPGWLASWLRRSRTETDRAQRTIPKDNFMTHATTMAAKGVPQSGQR